MSLNVQTNTNIDSARLTAIEFYKKKYIQHQNELAKLKESKKIELKNDKLKWMRH